MLTRKTSNGVKKQITSSKLVIADDGTLYHLGLNAHDSIGKNIVLVGDPDRAYEVANHFDKGISFEKTIQLSHHRELLLFYKKQ